MKALLFSSIIAFTLLGCTHIKLAGWEGDTYELCCSGSCKKEVWDQKSSTVCSGPSELLSGNNHSEVMGVHTHRSRRFTHSQITRRNVQCRRFRCKGKLIPTID